MKKCIISGHLVRFYPNIPEKLIQHTKKCKECADELKTIETFAVLHKEYKEFDELIKTDRCPDDNLFAAFLDGELHGTKRKDIEKHLLSCHYCFHMAAEFVKENYPAEETVDQLIEQVSTDSIGVQQKLTKVKEWTFEFINQVYPKESPLLNLIWRNLESSLTSTSDVFLSITPDLKAFGFTNQSNMVISKTALIFNCIVASGEIGNINDLEKTLEKCAEKYQADNSLKKEISTFLMKIYGF